MTPKARARNADEVRPLVLLVEDEESFIDALRIGLDREGFDVVVATDGAQAIEEFEASRPDLILLDLMLPKVSGIDVCRALRERSEVPIIVVSAKSEEIDTVLLLEMGADDYVTKPYRLRELVARMRAVQRRRVSAEPRLDGGAVVEAGGVRLEPDTRRCYVRGSEVKLRRKEFELLQLLLANSGLVLTRDVLIDRVWGSDYVGDTKTLDVHVKRLRALVEPDPKAPSLITTVRGVGYRFDAPKTAG
ncbi:MAG TPA: response regulator transcription factor [Acidimicrobiales bacterium]|nr:response regulator transcription factor [Acidimicrobiales bacterium]